jgi:hypothetical protein
VSDDELWRADEPPRTGAPDGDQVGSRVDELFSDAVDRQVAEQRNLNRLLTDVETAMRALDGRVEELQAQLARDVAPTADRMGTLEATVRSLRESQSQQHVTLRADLQDAVGGVRDDRRRGQQLVDELAELRQADASVGARLGDLQGVVEDHVPRLEAKLDRQARSLDEVGEQVAAGVRRGLAEMQDGLTEQHREDAEQVTAVRAEILSAVRDTMAEQRGQVDERFATLRTDLAAALTELRNGAAEQTGQVTDRFAALETVHRETLGLVSDEVAVQLGWLREGLDTRMSAGVDRLVAQTEQLGELLDGRVAGLRADVDARLERSERHAADVQAEVRAHRATAEEHGEVLESGLAGVRALMRTEVANAMDTLGAADDARSQHLRGLLEEWRSDAERRLEARAAQEADDHERAAAVLRGEATQVRDDLAGQRELLETGLAQAHRALTDQLESQRAEVLQLQMEQRAVVGEQLSEQRQALDRALADQRTELARQQEAVAGVAESVRATGASMTADLADLQTLSGELARHRQLEDEARQVLATTLVAELHRAIERLVDDQTASLDEVVTGVTGVGERITAAVADVRGGIEASRTELDRALAAVDAKGEDLEARLSGVVDGFSGQFRDQAAAATAGLEAATSGLSELSSRLDEMERSVVEGIGAHDERLDRERTRLLRDLVDQLAEGLSRRERKRLAGKLEVPTARGVTSAVSSPLPAKPSPEPSLVEPASTEPSIPLADLLAEVKGVGPAKQAVLLDAFGDPEAIRSATVDELAAVRGISPRLAEAINAHLNF